MAVVERLHCGIFSSKCTQNQSHQMFSCLLQLNAQRLNVQMTSSTAATPSSNVYHCNSLLYFGQVCLLLYPRFEKVGGILVYICPWFRPSFRNTFSSKLYPRFEKVGGILVYICPWFRPSFRPSFRNSVTLFRQRYLHNRLKVGSCPNNDNSVQIFFCPFLCSI